MTAPLRGQVYRVDVGHGLEPWLIVSNNRRNRTLSDVLAVRISTSSKHAELPTWVPLSAADPVVGYIVTDNLERIRRSVLGPIVGTAAPSTILAVNAALKTVLSIP
ncbi:type II toxin-antitoxin system PemK/MazF family toxin [Nocardia arthritidis]|uniref:Type II toxin-antitoxin system PemK/MazF family toxin n=1 Tax=Nocardia arthritidis TaxID=228602 RepID=A0A6G9YD85_9NOCA|nr:type II toxin-antitoxin system PemK/MazF family toxin [Nocardia arthritidis]QIS10973.1 type II toxin-antitoxin system PemK/MazF family toxin [Nocardia arthritidis]